MERYRRLNIKLTPQRLAILKYMDGNTSHPCAEEIYKAVRKRYPTMSFATVYNTLEALRERGNIRELKIDPSKKRYDPDTSPHHHIICTKCGSISDVHKDFVLNLPDEIADGFRVVDKNIEFFGTCRRCK